MSVEHRRFAAARQTGTATRKTRARRLASWFLIVPTLAAFSFSVVGNAAGFGKHPGYAAAVEAVRPSPSHDEPPPADKATYVVVSAPDRSNVLQHLLGGNKGREVCRITASQVAVVSQYYSTGRLTISVDGKPLDLVTVAGASRKDLTSLLGGHLSCHLVGVAGVFFLPFDAHGS